LEGRSEPKLTELKLDHETRLSFSDRLLEVFPDQPDRSFIHIVAKYYPIGEFRYLFSLYEQTDENMSHFCQSDYNSISATIVRPVRDVVFANPFYIWLAGRLLPNPFLAIRHFLTLSLKFLPLHSVTHVAVSMYNALALSTRDIAILNAVHAHIQALLICIRIRTLQSSKVYPEVRSET
jgi:hypothetical protein